METTHLKNEASLDDLGANDFSDYPLDHHHDNANSDIHDNLDDDDDRWNSI